MGDSDIICTGFMRKEGDPEVGSMGSTLTTTADIPSAPVELAVSETNDAISATDPESALTPPPFLVFREGDVIPMRGFNFKFIGYTKPDFKLIFEGQDMTGKALKRKQAQTRGHKIMQRHIEGIKNTSVPK